MSMRWVEGAGRDGRRGWGRAMAAGGRWVWERVRGMPRVAVNGCVVVGGFGMGVYGVISVFDDATFRLMGGLSPGWLLGLGAMLAVLAIVLRLAAGREVFRRIWKAAWKEAWIGGFVAASVRSGLVGVATAGLLLTAMNPARSDRVYLVVDKVGAGMKRDREELLRKVREIRAIYGPNYDVRFDSAELEELVNAERADWRAFDAAQQRLASLDERMGRIGEELRDRVGDRVVIVSERAGDRSLRNYPLDPSRIRNQWISIGSANAGNADRPEFTFLEIGNDLAVAGVFRLALRGKIEPPDVTLELLEGEAVVGGPFVLRPTAGASAGASAGGSTAPRAHFGRLSDTLQYECVLPRVGDRLRIGVTGAAWAAAAARVPDLGNGEFGLRKRRAGVAVGEGLSALTGLPSFVEEEAKAPAAEKLGVPLTFVASGGGADVSWALRGGKALPTGAVVEVVESKAAWGGERAMRLVRTAEYNATALGEVWLSPAWVSGWPDLGAGVVVSERARVLARTRGGAKEGSAVMWLPDAAHPEHVVVVVPKLGEIKQMSGEHQRGLGQLLMLATSLAMRGGGTESPMVARLFVADDTLGVVPEAGPREAGGLGRQIWRSLRGSQDEQPCATPGNSARAETVPVSLWAVAVLMAGGVVVHVSAWVRRRGS